LTQLLNKGANLSQNDTVYWGKVNIDAVDMAIDTAAYESYNLTADEIKVVKRGE